VAQYKKGEMVDKRLQEPLITLLTVGGAVILFLLVVGMFLVLVVRLSSRLEENLGPSLQMDSPVEDTGAEEAEELLPRVLLRQGEPVAAVW
jgi:hypothetical protein